VIQPDPLISSYLAPAIMAVTVYLHPFKVRLGGENHIKSPQNLYKRLAGRGYAGLIENRNYSITIGPFCSLL